MIERPLPFLIEPFQIMSDLEMYSFANYKLLKEEKNRHVWNLIVNHFTESLDEKEGGLGMARYSSTMKVLLYYMEDDCGRV